MQRGRVSTISSNGRDTGGASGRPPTGQGGQGHGGRDGGQGFERADVPILCDTWYETPYTHYAAALVDPPEGADALEEWELYWELAHRLGSEIRLEKTLLPLDRKPSKDELIGSTIVTVVVSVIVSIFIGIVDRFLTLLIRAIFGGGLGG